MPAAVHLGPDRELEDAEIVTLNEIVTSASISRDASTHPWRALHRAYQDVLGHHAIDEHPSSIYLRFLLLLRERQIKNPVPTLQAHFQQLLRENGIEIQLAGSSDIDSESYRDDVDYNSEDSHFPSEQLRGFQNISHEPGEVTINLERFGRPIDEVTKAARQWVPAPLLQRRASLESIHQASQSGARPDSARRRASFSQVEEDTKPLSPVITQPSASNFPEHQILKASTVAKASSQSGPSQPSLPAALSRTSRPHSQLTLLDEPEDAAFWDTFLKNNTQVAGKSDTQKQGPVSHGAINNQALKLRDEHTPPAAPPKASIALTEYPATKITDVDFGPTSAVLLATAKAVKSARTRELAKEILYQWDDRAQLELQTRQRQELRAAQWDGEQLKRDTFRVWLHTLRDVRVHKAERAAEQRRYALLEQWAEDARDRNLLTKAFQHWIVCAGEERSRVRQAKDHLLRLRYFKAWQDQVVETELKIRIFRLRVYFGKWQKSSLQFARNCLGSIDFYDDSLVRHQIMHWLLLVRKRKLQENLADNLRKSVFDKLLSTYTRIRENERMVLEAQQRAAIQSLDRRLRQQQDITAVAQDFARKRILYGALISIARGRDLCYKGRQVAYNMDWRIASNALSSLKQKLDLVLAAKHFDRQRLLRKLLLTWNGQLREHVFAKRVDDRLMAQCLYKWLLAERGCLFERLRTERLVHRSLVKIVQHRSQQSRELTEACITFKRLQKERLLRLVMQKWTARSRVQFQQRQLARTMHEQRLKEMTFETLNRRIERLELMQDQYLPYAELWFRGKASLRQWSEAARQARRKRRHESYAVVRRMVKQNLARTCLHTWQDRSNTVSKMEEQSQSLEARLSVSQDTDLIRGWRGLLDERRDQLRHAQHVHEIALLSKTIRLWLSRIGQVGELKGLALERDAGHIKNIVHEYLRKLHFRIGSIHDLNTSRRITDQLEWSRRRFCRSLLRFWYDKTILRRPTLGAQNRYPNYAMGRFLESPGPYPVLDAVISQRNGTSQSLGMTPAMPPPTPSRRRLGRTLRTPRIQIWENSTSPQASVTAPSSTVITAKEVNEAGRNPFRSSSSLPWSAMKVVSRQSRPFGDSTARALFTPISEQSADVPKALKKPKPPESHSLNN